MKRLLPLVILVTTLVGCPKPIPTAGGVIGIVVDCSEQAVKAAAVNLLPDVATALATAEWEAPLLALVEKFGEAAVDCAVQHLTSTALHDSQAAPNDKVAVDRYEHGSAWLTKRKTTFKTP